jgi:hypothetical protein
MGWLSGAETSLRRWAVGGQCPPYVWINLKPPNNAENPTRNVQSEVGRIITPPLMKIRAIAQPIKIQPRLLALALNNVHRPASINITEPAAGMLCHP